MSKTLRGLQKLYILTDRTEPERLQKMYDRTLTLQSQLLSLIYDRETFSVNTTGQSFAARQAWGENCNDSVSLCIADPLPSMKRLTEAIEEHWKAMLHSAIREASEQGPLPHFEKAFVEVEITTPRGTNNARVWDTSNRAIQVILNNLKGIFFRDDDMEHMAFAVVGAWGETGRTVITISDYNSRFRPAGRRQDE